MNNETPQQEDKFQSNPDCINEPPRPYPWPVTGLQVDQTKCVRVEFECVGSEKEHSLQVNTWGNGEGFTVTIYDSDMKTEVSLDLGWDQWSALASAVKQLEENT